jgi:sporulation protein YlmC with PRC-barrel domain
MEVPLGAEVKCVEDVCGRSAYLVIDPITEEITHVVVRHAHWPHTEYLVSLDYVLETNAHEIRLRCTNAELEKMPPFIQTEFVREELPDLEMAMPPFYYWPYVAYEGTAYVPVSHEQIPPNELAIRKGARVEATDGQIGHVDEFLMDPRSGHISHLVMREGPFWSQKDVTIPVSEIDRIDEDSVLLTLTKDEVGALPAIPLKRRYPRP